MADTLSFVDFFDILNKKTREISSELEDIITADIEDTPPLIKIKDMDERYKYYSEAVNIGLKLGRLISNAYFTRDACARAKFKLQKEVSAPPKLLSQYIRDTDSLIQELDALIQSSTSYKAGVDNVIRFYQNVCYMFGGIIDVKSSI